MSIEEDELRDEVILMAKEAVRERVEEFVRTPLGQVLDAAGQELVNAKSEGRELTPFDLARFCLDRFKIHNANTDPAPPPCPDTHPDNEEN